MKALYFNQHGTIDNIHFGELPEPTIGEDEVLLRVRACSINHLDLWILRGWPGLKLNLPHVGGADIAGEVVGIGRKVFGWSVGARVILQPGFVTSEDEWTRSGEESLSPSYQIFGENRAGGFAEYVAAPARTLYPLPEQISFVEGCAPLLVSLTAWRMLKYRAGLSPGETVLIVGAGGGVNSMAIQIARYLGAEVIALTSSPEKAARATSLGAQTVVDYKAIPDWSREVRRLTNNRGVDVVVDNVGAATFEQSLRAVARGGRIVTVGNTSGPVITFDNRLVFTKQISLIGSTMGSAQDFKEVIPLLHSGALKPVIDRELPLEEGRAAYETLERVTQFGKVVIVP